MLFLTRGPYALLRFPQFCLREIPVFGYAYAVLTRSLWMRFCCTNMQRELTHEAFLIAATLSEQKIRTRRRRRWACATSLQNEVLPSSLRGFVSLLIAGMVSLWAALWTNEWANGQGDSWALRMPYAYLTHSLRKSLTIHWDNWGSTQTKDASDGWFFEQVMLQKVSVLSMWQFTSFVLDHLNWQTNATMINDDETTWICIQVRDMIWDNPTARLPLPSLHFWDYILRLCAIKRVCNDINDRLKLHTTE